MKKKLKKLALNKETISNLQKQELNNIKGGDTLLACTNSCQETGCTQDCKPIDPTSKECE